MRLNQSSCRSHVVPRRCVTGLGWPENLDSAVLHIPSTIPAGLQAIDCLLKVGSVAVHVEVARLRPAVGGVEPASLIGVRVGQAGFAGQQRITGGEGAVDDGEEITDRLEAFDRAEPAAGANGLPGFHFEHHFDEFA